MCCGQVQDSFRKRRVHRLLGWPVFDDSCCHILECVSDVSDRLQFARRQRCDQRLCLYTGVYRAKRWTLLGVRGRHVQGRDWQRCVYQLPGKHVFNNNCGHTIKRCVYIVSFFLQFARRERRSNQMPL